ncbi:DNA modification methylase [Algoriphagus sp. AK58]|nr:DNA modification methylase [Algoriphagus sp. AK58]
MSIPIHGWYRYTAGFSAEWVKDLILESKKIDGINIVEPFVGSGTVLLEAEFAGVNSMGVESHPYIYRIAKTKLQWNYNIKEFKDAALELLKVAEGLEIKEKKYPKLIEKCYPLETIEKLESLKFAWNQSKDNEEIKNFTWFIITSILRTTSPVGTAQWQYIQPNKSKGKVLDPYQAYELKVIQMAKDMEIMQSKNYNNDIVVNIYNEDARNIESIPENWGDLVITSPPYANNYDYADATRLEMTFWGDIEGWSDLQDKVRKRLIRACTQHVSSMQKEVNEFLDDPILNSIREELKEVYETLKVERLSHGGKKNYHFMIVAYFYDMAKVFQSLRRIMRNGSKMCFVIGDSAPYGIYVPVDIWLGELAISAGFTDYTFEKLRDRNVKWKNRKHRVPLKEGRLWING